MQPAMRGALVALAASAAGSGLTGAAAAVAISLYPPGSEGLPPALWGFVVLPVAVALVVAAVLSRSAGGVFLNSAAFLLPQVIVAVVVFFLFAHPGGAGGEGLVLSTGEFWLKLAVVYAVVVALVGAGSFFFRLARR